MKRKWLTPEETNRVKKKLLKELKERIKDEDLSQKEVAHYLDMTPQNLSTMINDGNPTLKTLIKLSHLLGWEIKWEEKK